ncbi:MAG: hypothetical protein DMG54_30595 [Acidobacteria bacterium]|nr:MAG: hypothetical protein DMG54_30595 [Acidobacteriota bacterium]
MALEFIVTAEGFAPTPMVVVTVLFTKFKMLTEFEPKFTTIALLGPVRDCLNVGVLEIDTVADP